MLDAVLTKLGMKERSVITLDGIGDPRMPRGFFVVVTDSGEALAYSDSRQVFFDVPTTVVLGNKRAVLDKSRDSLPRVRFARRVP